MCADKKGECRRIHFFNCAGKIDVAVNGRRTGVKHKQPCIRCIGFHALKCLGFVQPLGGSIDKSDIKAIFFGNAGCVNQPERVVQDAAVTNRRAPGFAGKLAIFCLEWGVDKTNLHFDAPVSYFKCLYFRRPLITYQHS